MPGLRIGVTCAGDPRDPTAFSGSPASLLRGLREAGAEGVALPAVLPDALQRTAERAATAVRLRPRDARNLRAAVGALRWTAMGGPEIAAVRAATAGLHARRAGRLDGIVQYGTEFTMPGRAPIVTYEDSTLRQAERSFDWPWIANTSPEVRDRWVAAARRRYARAHANAFMSHWAARSAIDEYGVPAERAHVVGGGRNHEPPNPVRDWSAPRALFVGRDWERKNGPMLLRAFARLRDAWPEARLDVVGGHPRLDAPGVTGHGLLSLADPRERAVVERLFGEATFFVMPSLHEPAGLVYAEAQAAGLASIGTTAGGAATIVGDAGRLVDPADEGALVAALLELAEPDTARRLGALAERRAPLFTWRMVAERMLRALAPPGIDVSGLAAFL